MVTLESAAPWLARATSCRDALAPSARVPIVSSKTPGATCDQPGSEAPASNVRPAGSVSRRTTPVASDGPLFVAVSVYVARSPAATLAEPVLAICTSATGVTVTSASSSLLASDGSPVSEDTDALLAIAPASTARTVIVTVAEPPLAIVPRSQLTSGASYVQPALADSNSTPLGSASPTETNSAASGPSFDTTSV